MMDRKSFNSGQPKRKRRASVSPGQFALRYQRTFAHMGKVFWEQGVLPLDSVIHQHIRKKALQHGVGNYVPYLYYMLFEQSAYWPEMPPQNARALRFLKRVITKAASVPNYSRALSIPNWEDEEKVAAALKALSIWARTNLKVLVKRAYLEVVRKHTPAASMWLNLDSPDPNQVRQAFEAAVLEVAPFLGEYKRDLWAALQFMRS